MINIFRNRFVKIKFKELKDGENNRRDRKFKINENLSIKNKVLDRKKKIKKCIKKKIKKCIKKKIKNIDEIVSIYYEYIIKFFINKYNF